MITPSQSKRQAQEGVEGGSEEVSGMQRWIVESGWLIAP